MSAHSHSLMSLILENMQTSHNTLHDKLPSIQFIIHFLTQNKQPKKPC